MLAQLAAVVEELIYLWLLRAFDVNDGETVRAVADK